jgi:hypothetical protein
MVDLDHCACALLFVCLWLFPAQCFGWFMVFLSMMKIGTETDFDAENFRLETWGKVSFMRSDNLEMISMRHSVVCLCACVCVCVFVMAAFDACNRSGWLLGIAAATIFITGNRA